MAEWLQSGFQMPEWREIPDLGLYMDQVLYYVQRVYEPLYGEAAENLLTSSMVNNYVKNGLLPRPTGKKYGREQLAAILMLVQLKGVLSMDMIGVLLNGEPAESLYAAFCEKQRAAMQAFQVQDPLTAAAQAAMYALSCEQQLHMRAPEAGVKSQNRKHKK